MNVLGIDPGNHFGWAVAFDGELVESGNETLKKDASIFDVARTRLNEVLTKHTIEVVIVEQPWIRQGNTSFFAIATQWQNVFAWHFAAELHGLRSIWVSPTQWQAAFGLAKGKREERQEATVKLGCALAKKKALQTDEACAIFIALWGSRCLERTA